MNVKVINKSNFKLPEYKTELSSGMDVMANIPEEITLKPMETKHIPTGLYVAIPEGFEIQIRSRSGLSLNEGLVVLNAPATIDADYRGEIGVIIINMSTSDRFIKPGDRIAQIVLTRHATIDWETVEKLPESLRGVRGLGSTGVNDIYDECENPIIMEFCPKTEKHQTANINTFHFNWIRKDGKPESELFENNYQPIVIFDSKISTTERFKEIHDRIYKIGKSSLTPNEKFKRMYEIAAELENVRLMKRYPLIQEAIETNKKCYLKP